MNRSALLVLGLGLLTLSGCQQKMARQPSYRPLAPSEFFSDGRASRSPPAGTVARRDLLLEDPQLESGAIATGPEAGRLATLVGPHQALALGVLAAAALQANPAARYYDTFPFAVTEADLRRGQERFNIYCAVCHDRLGTGNGIIVQRGYPRPPNLLTDLSRGLQYQGIEVPLREAPVGYFFEVIVRGYGAMPSYASQVPPRDRWLIAAYIRALQPVRWQDLPEDERQRLEKQIGRPGPEAKP